MLYNLPFLERGGFNATKTVLWCNGNTSDFGSEIPSSNLGRITITLFKPVRLLTFPQDVLLFLLEQCILSLNKMQIY